MKRKWIETLLDSKLNADKELITKFFKAFDNRKRNFEDCFPIYETMDITPAILGFDVLAYISAGKTEPEEENRNAAKYISTDADAPSLTNAIIGTVKQIIRNSPYERARRLVNS